MPELDYSRQNRLLKSAHSIVRFGAIRPHDGASRTAAISGCAGRAPAITYFRSWPGSDYRTTDVARMILGMLRTGAFDPEGTIETVLSEWPVPDHVSVIQTGRRARS